MEPIGWAVRIPESFTEFRQGGRYEYMRRIDVHTDPSSWYLALLIGLIDTRNLDKLDKPMYLGLFDEPKKVNLFRFLEKYPNFLLQHHCLKHFNRIRQILKEVCQDMLQKEAYNTSVLYEGNSQCVVEGAVFQIAKRGEFYFTLYPANFDIGEIQLCCGCMYKKDIFTAGIDNYQLPCTHHEKHTLDECLWRVKPVKCELAFEETVLSGKTFKQCQLCEKTALGCIVSVACRNNCELCLDCLLANRTSEPFCSKCWGLLNYDAITTVASECHIEGTHADNLKALPRSLRCSSCNSPAKQPFRFTEGRHKNCAVCVKCPLSESCGWCGQQLQGEEVGQFQAVKQSRAECWLCFAGHQCDRDCFLCQLSLTYSYQFNTQQCLNCHQPISFSECEYCRRKLRDDRFVDYSGSKICRNCFEAQPRADETLAASGGEADPQPPDPNQVATDSQYQQPVSPIDPSSVQPQPDSGSQSGNPPQGHQPIIFPIPVHSSRVGVEVQKTEPENEQSSFTAPSEFSEVGKEEGKTEEEKKEEKEEVASSQLFTDEGKQYCKNCNLGFGDIDLPDYLYHKCSSPNFSCCLWCLITRLLQSPTREFCPGCQQTVNELFSLEMLKSMLECDVCRKNVKLSEFLYRSRCSTHRVCRTCACLQLLKTNGRSGCQRCVELYPNPLFPIQQDSSQVYSPPLCGCREVSSPEVHCFDGPQPHPICWKCAMKENPNASACKCGGFFSDKMREALCITSESVCRKCQKNRSLFTLRCKCKASVCVFCITVERSDGSLKVICRDCGDSHTAPDAWVQQERESCAGCLESRGSLVRLNCGHFYHPKCLLRTYKCVVCTPLRIDE